MLSVASDVVLDSLSPRPYTDRTLIDWSTFITAHHTLDEWREALCASADWFQCPTREYHGARDLTTYSPLDQELAELGIDFHNYMTKLYDMKHHRPDESCERMDMYRRFTVDILNEVKARMMELNRG